MVNFTSQDTVPYRYILGMKYFKGLRLHRSETSKKTSKTYATRSDCKSLQERIRSVPDK